MEDKGYGTFRDLKELKWGRAEWPETLETPKWFDTWMHATKKKKIK